MYFRGTVCISTLLHVLQLHSDMKINTMSKNGTCVNRFIICTISENHLWQRLVITNIIWRHLFSNLIMIIVWWLHSVASRCDGSTRRWRSVLVHVRRHVRMLRPENKLYYAAVIIMYRLYDVSRRSSNTRQPRSSTVCNHLDISWTWDLKERTIQFIFIIK